MLEFEDGELAHPDRLEWNKVYTREPGDVHDAIMAAQLPEDAVVVRDSRRANQFGCTGEWALVFNGETHFCHQDSFVTHYTAIMPDDHAEPTLDLPVDSMD